MRIRAERKALKDLVCIFMALRDLTNNPLQSIELTAWLMKNRQLSHDESASCLERALVQLRQLSELLAFYEKDVEWPGTRASFDPVHLLQQKLAEVKAMGQAEPLR